MILGGYVTLALLLAIGEGLWQAGQLYIASEQIANDFQVYGALALSFILLLSIRSFTRRDFTVWLGLGLFWVLGFLVILPNIFRFGEVIWKTGAFTLTLERLAPAWGALGWLVFTLAGYLSVRSVYKHSRQPLLRNRLNYWSPVFLLIVLNDVLVIVNRPLPGNPIRLAAATLAGFIVVTHDPPDLREVARRVFTYIITTLVIVAFYVAGFSASQTVFDALPNYNPLLVGAGIALLLSFIFTPLTFGCAALGEYLVQCAGVPSQQNAACLQRADQ